MSEITADARVKTLQKTQIFEAASEDVLTEVADRLQEIHLQKDETLFFKGSKGHAMYIIERGSVQVHDKSHVFDTLGPGEVFGEYSLIDTEVRSASITGAEDSLLFSLDKDAFYDLLHTNRDVLQGILRLMVTRLRKLDVVQEELAQKNIQIEKQKTEIEAQNDSLVTLNEEKNHLIGIVAHDIRNPLSSASTFANLLQSDEAELSDDHNEYVKYLLRSINRMTDLVTRILDVKIIEEQTLAVKPIVFNLHDEITDIVRTLQDSADKKDIKVHTELIELSANLDQGLFRQIAENLVSNAIKFSPEEKSVWIKLTSEGQKILLEIKDEGQGLSENDKKKLFGKFQQLSAKPTGGESSTGLGLSIVKKFTDSMQGKVWVESEKGQGAAFFVELPIFQ